MKKLLSALLALLMCFMALAEGESITGRWQVAFVAENGVTIPDESFLMSKAILEFTADDKVEAFSVTDARYELDGDMLTLKQPYSDYVLFLNDKTAYNDSYKVSVEGDRLILSCVLLSGLAYGSLLEYIENQGIEEAEETPFEFYGDSVIFRALGDTDGLIGTWEAIYQLSPEQYEEYLADPDAYVYDVADAPSNYYTVFGRAQFRADGSCSFIRRNTSNDMLSYTVTGDALVIHSYTFGSYGDIPCAYRFEDGMLVLTHSEEYFDGEQTVTQTSELYLKPAEGLY